MRNTYQNLMKIYNGIKTLSKYYSSDNSMSPNAKPSLDYIDAAILRLEESCGKKINVEKCINVSDSEDPLFIVVIDETDNIAETIFTVTDNSFNPTLVVIVPNCLFKDIPAYSSVDILMYVLFKVLFYDSNFTVNPDISSFNAACRLVDIPDYDTIHITIALCIVSSIIDMWYEKKDVLNDEFVEYLKSFSNIEDTALDVLKNIMCNIDSIDKYTDNIHTTIMRSILDANYKQQ